MSSGQQVRKLVINTPPDEYPNLSLGENDSTFRIEETNIKPDSIENGEVLIRVIYLSNDPSQRMLIQKGADPKEMYRPPVKKGEVMPTFGAGEVIKSKSRHYTEGDIVAGFFSWSDYVLVREDKILSKIDKDIDPSIFLNLGGYGGLAAYFGLLKVADVKPNHVVVVSAASGSTGSIAIQLAKKVIGCKKVIGITGSNEKILYVKSLGADAAVNFKSLTFEKKLDEALGENQVDIFFDNVGGEVLDHVLSRMSVFGTISVCGAIAGYNKKDEGKIYNWKYIIIRRLRVFGFLLSDHYSEVPGAIQALFEAVKSGQLSVENSSTVVDLSKEKDPFVGIPKAWGLLFESDKKLGKLVTKIA